MRLRLTWVAALLALTMVASAVTGVVATYRQAGEELREVLEDDLENQCRLLLRLLSAPQARQPAPALGQLLRSAFPDDDEETLWVNLYDAGTRSLLGSNLRHALPLQDATDDELRLSFAGHSWHGCQRRGGGLVVQLLRRSDRYAEVGGEILEDIMLPVLAGSAINLGLLAVLIGLSLWPLAGLVRELGIRHADSLAPLKKGGMTVEIGTLREALNRMMANVDSTLQRERHFASDVAHELRTPLTTLKLELASTHPDQQVLKAEVDRLAGLVGQLLILARLEQGRWHAAFSTVDLEALCLHGIARFEARMQQAGMVLQAALEPVVVEGEATLLQALLDNLLDNLLAHCPPGTQALLRLRREAGQAVLELIDTGPGLSASQRQQMGRDFTRFDSRGPGLGLGLAICQRIAHAHGASLSFLAREDGQPGLRVRLAFPR